MFTAATGSALDPDNVGRKFRTLCDKAGIGHPRFHALRHTTATLLLDQGIPLNVISVQLGHSSLAITADIYAKVSKPALTAAGVALERALG